MKVQQFAHLIDGSSVRADSHSAFLFTAYTPNNGACFDYGGNIKLLGRTIEKMMRDDILRKFAIQAINKIEKKDEY